MLGLINFLTTGTDNPQEGTNENILGGSDLRHLGAAL